MSLASGVNATPHAVGFSFAVGQARAMLWGPSGLRQDLGTLDGSDMTFGMARALNENSHVIGTSFDGSVMRATVWRVDEVGTPPSTSCGTTLEDKIDCLIAQVNAMEGLGNKGRARSLLAKLEAAKKQAGRQNERAAKNIVNAFTKQVHAFVLAGILEAEGESEIAAILNPAP